MVLFIQWSPVVTSRAHYEPRNRRYLVFPWMLWLQKRLEPDFPLEMSSSQIECNKAIVVTTSICQRTINLSSSLNTSTQLFAQKNSVREIKLDELFLNLTLDPLSVSPGDVVIPLMTSTLQWGYRSLWRRNTKLYCMEILSSNSRTRTFCVHVLGEENAPETNHKHHQIQR